MCADMSGINLASLEDRGDAVVANLPCPDVRTPSGLATKGGWHGRALNITKRGKIWYFKKMVQGRRAFQSLNTTDKELAKARAKDLAGKAAGEKWEAIDRLKSKRTVATVAELLEVYKREARVRGLSESSVNGYCQRIILMVRTVSGIGDMAQASTALLTEDLVLDFQRKRMTAVAGADNLAREREQRTVNAVVRNARAIFARWVRGTYEKELELPDVRPFRKARLQRAEVRTYRLPPQALIDKTLAEGRKLRETNPKLYAVFLLAYDLALRAGEAAACEWSWFSERRCERRTGECESQRCVEILRRENFTPKWKKERRVPVSDEVWKHLSERRTGVGESKFVVDGGTRHLRELTVKREFSGWLRSIGWSRRTYPKAAHELRKLMGSRWFTELGAEVAQAWLGHTNVATTCSFYTALRKQPKPLAMD